MNNLRQVARCMVLSLKTIHFGIQVRQHQHLFELHIFHHRRYGATATQNHLPRGAETSCRCEATVAQPMAPTVLQRSQEVKGKTEEKGRKVFK